MKKFIIICAVLATLILAELAQAEVTVAYDPGVLHTTDELSSVETDGADMVGMTVNADFVCTISNIPGIPVSQTASWVATGADAGGASGTGLLLGWSLSESGNTFGSSWTLTNDTGWPLTSIKINAAPGDIVFDVWEWKKAGTLGTDGSQDGREFELISAPSGFGDITATYRNEVALTGQAPVGDLWALLQLDFEYSLQSGSTLVFIADTDMTEGGADVVPIIPAPGAILLGSIGVGLVGWLRRRRTL